MLRNVEILCFINPKKIKKYIKFLKENVYTADNEQQFITYFEKYWIKQKIDLFNYYNLIQDIIKLKKAYINNKGSANSEKNLISMVKSLEKVYLTNNICE